MKFCLNCHSLPVFHFDLCGVCAAEEMENNDRKEEAENDDFYDEAVWEEQDEDRGGTGHGDIFWSDADPGL